MLKCNEENCVEGHLSLEQCIGEGYSQQIAKKNPINLDQYKIWCRYQNICDEPRLIAKNSHII